MMDMQRVLALQGLGSFVYDDPQSDSNISIGCSSASTGQGNSGCSVSCFDEAEMTW